MYFPVSSIFIVALFVICYAGESRRRRTDDVLHEEVVSMLQTQAQQITELKAKTTALETQLTANKLQLGKCSTTTFFTAHLSQARPAYGEAVLFDVIQADSARAYDTPQRAYIVPFTGIYWVNVIADVVSDGARAVLELYADEELLGSADANDVSEAVYSGAFSLSKGQKLIVRRAHDQYDSGNRLQSRTSFSVVLVNALYAGYWH